MEKWICDNCATGTNLACFGSVGTLSGFQVVYPEKATSIDVVQHYISLTETFILPALMQQLERARYIPSRLCILHQL